MRRVVDGVLALYPTGAGGVPQICGKVVGACVRRLFDGVAVRVSRRSIQSSRQPPRHRRDACSTAWRLISTPVGAEGRPQRFFIKGLADDRSAANAAREQLTDRYSGRSVM